MIQRNSLQKRLKIFILLSLFILLIPISYSNGGCIKFEDDILVQLSSSPLVPIVNEQTSFLISFANIRKELINDEITGKLWIAKSGRSEASGELKNQGFLSNGEKILTKDFKFKDGILDLKHTFKKEGLYEIFLEFDYKNKTYTPEDFLIEVKEENNQVMLNFLMLTIGIVIGALLMKFIKAKN